mgnify:FL=1
MWKEGTVSVNGEIFHYWLKQYEEGSEFGINGGRISKLTIKRSGREVYNYDRGEDIAPIDKNTETALAIILKSDN